MLPNLQKPVSHEVSLSLDSRTLPATVCVSGYPLFVLAMRLEGFPAYSSDEVRGSPCLLTTPVRDGTNQSMIVSLTNYMSVNL